MPTYSEKVIHNPWQQGVSMLYLNKMSSYYRPTNNAHARMMKAIEYAKRKGFGYQKCVGIFRRLQHEANEGTHAGHFEKLEQMYNFYTKTPWLI